MLPTTLLLLSSVCASPPLAATPVDGAADRGTLVDSNTQFALELYQKLRTQPGNVFVSPYSVSSALGMTYAGARAETAEEMARTLHFALAAHRLHPAFGALTSEMLGTANAKDGAKLRIINALWCRRDFTLNPAFLQVNRAHYGAGVNSMDFARATEQSRQTINSAIERWTEGKIRDLLPSGAVTPETRLILTNAIWFKGAWQNAFEKNSTKDGDFQLADGTKVQTPLMHQTDHFGYLETDAFQILEMPYVGRNLSMVVLLPKRVDGLDALEAGLTAAKLKEQMQSLFNSEVIVTLPRFKFEAAVELTEVLARLGMRRLFTAHADLSGIAGRPGDLAVSAVIHKAFVEVNEGGTEAAAATAVVGAPTAAPNSAPPSRPPEFRADHPFLFLIRDTRSGSVLFLGRVVDPR